MQDSTMRASKTFSRIGLALVAISGLTSVLQLLLAAALAAFASGGASAQESWVTWIATFVPLYVVGMPVGIWIMHKLPVQQFQTVKLGGKNFFLFMLMCFPLMYGGNIVGTVLSMLLSSGQANNAIMGYIFDSSPLKVLVIVVLAPLLEEFIFRKQIIDRIGCYGEKTAILFSALTFGLFHMNLFQFFYAFALGLLFAYVYTRTRRLRYSVAMHMVINFMGSVLAPMLLSGVDMEVLNQISTGAVDQSVLVSMLPQLLGLICYMLVLVGLSITGLVFLCIKAPKLVYLPAAEELPKGKRFKTVYCNVGMILFVLLCCGVCVWSLIG